MDIINQLRTLTDQLNEHEKFLSINYSNYCKSEKNLEGRCQAALLDLKDQLQTALKEERLLGMKFIVSEEQITQILSANAKKKDYQEQREKIVEVMNALNGRRHKLFKDNSEILEDFGTAFWRVCANPTASFEFEASQLRIKSDDGEFEVPYRRFTEPKEVILAEIASSIEEMKLNEQKLHYEKMITAINIKLAELKKADAE